MGKVFCKIWSFFLNLFRDAMDAIAYALDTIGTVALELLDGVGEVIGNVVGNIFGGSNFMIWLAVGVGAYFLLKNDNKTRVELANSANPTSQRSVLSGG